MITDEIDTFTESGIRVKSGQQLDADIVVSSTDCRCSPSGASSSSSTADLLTRQAHSFVYKGAMLSNVPNFAFCVGYTNASWGLRADLASTFVCRLLNHMDRHRYRTCLPPCDTSSLDSKPLLDLTSATSRVRPPARPSSPVPSRGSFRRTTYSASS